MAAATSSAGASAASVIAAASESANSIMASAASMVQQARADATAVRVSFSFFPQCPPQTKTNILNSRPRQTPKSSKPKAPPYQ
jgi:hypothetical protein